MSSGLKNGSKQFYLDHAPKRKGSAGGGSYLKPGAGVNKKKGGLPGSKRKRMGAGRKR